MLERLHVVLLPLDRSDPRMAPESSFPYDADESILYWVLSTARRLEHLLSEEMRPLGITFRQVEVIGTLGLEGERSQTELANRLGVEPPTMAGILSRMEENGWIERVSCARDRRKKIIRLTDQVLPVWSTILEQGRQTRAEASRGLTAEELRALRDLLTRVRDNAEGALEARNGDRKASR